MTGAFKAIARQLLGVGYKSLWTSCFVCSVLAAALTLSDTRMTVAPSVLYLMTAMFAAGIMWQALRSAGNARRFLNMFMLPFENRSMALAYVSAFSFYALMTKTAPLLAILFSLGHFSPMTMVRAVLCAAAASLMTALWFGGKSRHAKILPALWVAAIAATMVVYDAYPMIFTAVLGSSVALALLPVSKMDAYAFVRPEHSRSKTLRFRKSGSVCIYLFRYLRAHKNYLANTAGLWIFACLLPLLLAQDMPVNVKPMGFALLTLNTPLCILVSCSPQLRQALWTLPGQGLRFWLPYSLLLFGFNLSAMVIYLISWQIQTGRTDLESVVLAVTLAWLSAILSALLEWFRPLTHWKIESDLWHHPRKYVVPGSMLAIAMGIGILPQITYIFPLVVMGISLVLFIRLRHC